MILLSSLMVVVALVASLVAATPVALVAPVAGLAALGGSFAAERRTSPAPWRALAFGSLLVAVVSSAVLIGGSL